MLSSVFNDHEADIDTLTNRFIKKLKGCIAKNFRKVRISKKKKQTEPEKLHERMTKLKYKTDQNSKEEIDKIVIELAKAAEENIQKVKDELEKVRSNKGGMNAKQIWRLYLILLPCDLSHFYKKALKSLYFPLAFLLIF